MNQRMTAQELISRLDTAIQEHHLFLCYQPQINHATGRMMGAEALLRWRDPDFGMQYPSDFIPVLEAGGLLPKADLFVVEEICIFLKKCRETGLEIVPISFNMSRYDIDEPGFIDAVEAIRAKYEIPVRCLRVEITESATIGGMELVLNAYQKLHALGYLVEMDDFGSGYSSLNVLKDLPVDIIKLDMRFMGENTGGRAGAIISSVVRMAKWLHTPVIAEGVETLDQADYMRSVGCNYIQGYLYSKPLEEAVFIEKLRQVDHEPLKFSEAGNALEDIVHFWDPDSEGSRFFEHFAGAAAFFSYENGEIEVMRVNKKYLSEIGMNLTEKETIQNSFQESCEEASLAVYERAIQKAIETGEESVCETWRTVHSECCGDDRVCIRSTLHPIGRDGEHYLFYAMVQNITAEKKHLIAITDSEMKFRFAAEQANMYAWEYIVATHEMRPCFRCMRDLGLPPLLKNYPDSAIEAGIFPPDYADMYRDWHRQIAEGVEHLEGIIPLTVGRVPFHVRYTTEFDENGRPLKAYGSATLVVDDTPNP